MSSADLALEQLIERLLTDAQFRAEFRRTPGAALAAAGLPELAAELGSAGNPMHTLTLRESRSSLAGVVMAMAVEGMSVAEAQALIHHGPAGVAHGKLPHGLGHLRHAASPAAVHRAAAVVAGSGGGAAGARSGVTAAATPSGPAAAAAGGHGTGSAASGAGGSGAAGSGAAMAHSDISTATAPRDPMPPHPGAQPIDGGAVPVWPDQQANSGGAAMPGAGVGAAPGGLTALLDSQRLSAPANVRSFLASGGADPRMVSVLDSALANHTIVLGQIEAVSDPAHVQAIDIIAVDGQPVGPGNFAARDLVTEIAALDPSLRPSEIGTPWPIHSPGFFSDPTAANRLHLAFEMPGTNTPGAAAPTAGGVASAAAPANEVAYPPPTGQPAAGGLAAMPGGAAPGVASGAGVPLTDVVPAPMAAATPGSGVDSALAYAHAMIGKLPESAGSNLGPQLDKFEADFGFHGAPWCGIFAGHVLEAAGLKPPHSVASVASILDLARNGDPPFVKGILPVSEARPGDLVTFGGTEHVAVVTKVDAAGIHTIAGNTSQSNVSETTYSPGSVTGLVRPDYASGKPGSVPGVWNYAGVQPPTGGAQASAAAVSQPLGSGAPPTTPPPAGAEIPMPSAPPAEQPAFNLPSSHGHVRPTVQFLPAVKPSPESPLYGAAAGEPAAMEQAAGSPAPGVPLEQATPGGLVDQITPGAGGSLTVSSSLLTDGQAKFAARLAELTGLDPRVVSAWELAEESGGAARAREAASNFNWLNIGYFDSGAGRIAFDQAFSDPTSAAEQTAKFLKGTWGGASAGIRAILSTVGQGPQQQMTAIANSGWASSHYDGGASLRGTYDELGDIHVVRTGST